MQFGIDGTSASSPPAPTTTPPVPDPDTTPQIEELYSAWALTILCFLLILSLWTSYYVQIKRIRAVHETVLSIFAGMVVGLIVRLAPGHLIREMLTFKHTLFFNLLLPPIILNSGYELKQENFFRNIGSILTFAFLGTFISAVGIGILCYLYSLLGLEGLNLSLIECLIFGSTLSATDPVTILAIFNQHKVDPKLYSVIFGESILNDAVSIVMYETLSQFHGAYAYTSSIIHGVGIFLFSFCTSLAMGVSFGLFCSLMLKHSSLHLYPGIESCLVALIAYTSYFFSNGLHLSGIVSLLFCGVTLKHYAYHTMSKKTQRTTKYMFSVLAQLSENFIFIYLGLNLFTQDVQVFKPLFIFVALMAVFATRYAAVFPLSEAINFFHRTIRRKSNYRGDELPHSYQMMLFWAGLRGAVGVALAAGFTGENAPALRTTVLMVVVLTVIMLGGTTARMLEVLKIRVGVEDNEDSSADEGNPHDWLPSSPGGRREGTGWNITNHHQLGTYANGRAGLNRNSRIFSATTTPIAERRSLSEESDAGEVLPSAEGGDGHGSGADGKWFTALDERYLLPLFSNSVASRQFYARRARRMASTTNLESTAGEESDIDEPQAGEDFRGSMGEFFRSIRGSVGNIRGNTGSPSSPSMRSPFTSGESDSGHNP